MSQVEDQDCDRDMTPENLSEATKKRIKERLRSIR